jgi:hypothetical protein
MEKHKEIFNINGYYIEYFIDNKYIGYVSCKEKDREKLGFFGEFSEIASNDIVLSNKKVIKKGTLYKSYLQELNGKKI